VFFCKTDGVVEALRLAIVQDSFTHVSVLFVVASEVEAGLGVVCLESKLRCILNVIDIAKNAHATSEVLGFSIEFKSFIDDTLSFKILSPPFVKSGFSLSNHELL
jgi:hypothetical protein